MKTTPLLKNMGILAPWLCCTMAAVFWFNSSQDNFQYQFEHTANAEPRSITLTRSNLRTFNRSAPRHDLIAVISPFGRTQANAWNLYLTSNWEKQSVTEQQRLMNEWATLSLQIVKMNPANASKPQLCIHNWDGSLIRHVVEA
ncbi:hypothetical protein IAD21_05583 [Abditibacteriota bacterium]|nr:hypothetical protein IAD21_05583 [Abditibacteriota bacterium]